VMAPVEKHGKHGREVLNLFLTDGTAKKCYRANSEDKSNRKVL